MRSILKQTCMEIPLLRALGEPGDAHGDDRAGALVWSLGAETGWALAVAQIGGRMRQPLPPSPPSGQGAILARSARVEEHTGHVLARQIQICLRGAASCRITPRWLVVVNGSGRDCERADLEFLLGLAANEGCEWLACSDRDRISRNPDCSIAFERRLKRAGARLHVPRVRGRRG